MNNNEQPPPRSISLSSHTIEAPNDGEWRVLPLDYLDRIGECKAIFPQEETELTWNGVTCRNEHVTKSVRMMGLFRIDPDSVMQRLKDERDQAVSARLAAEDKSREDKSALEDSAKEIIKLETELQHCSGSNEALRQERTEKHEQIRRYENDIAKIRTALGDLRMKEILG